MMKAASPARRAVLARVAAAVPASRTPDCVRVAVDGVDGAGKTRLADELAALVRAAGRPAIRISVDDFHNVRALRYRRGRRSPTGYWLNAFNYERLRRDVLDPLGPGGSRRYRPAAHDVATDRELDPPSRIAPAGSVLLLDGVFLHRDELAGAWDLSIFLRVPFEVTTRRMARRDGAAPDPWDPSIRRYVDAQRRHFASCAPEGRATIVIDNADLASPRILKLPSDAARPR